MGWLAGYGKRKEIVTTESETDYQVIFSIGEDSGGDFSVPNSLSFPNDIRFTNETETEEIPYWIEDLTVDPVSCWVLCDDTSESIYCYFGKAGDSTTSSGTDTFPIFFDFSVEPTVVELDWGAREIEYIDITDIDIEGKEIRTKIKWTAIQTSVYGSIGNTGVRDTIVENQYVSEFGFTKIDDTDHDENYLYSAYNYSVGGSTGFNPVLNTIYTVRQRFLSGDYILYCNGNSITHESAYSEGKQMKYWQVCGGYVQTNGWVDIVYDAENKALNFDCTRKAASVDSYIKGTIYGMFVKKYAAIEPAFSSAGEEESAPTGFPHSWGAIF